MTRKTRLPTSLFGMLLAALVIEGAAAAEGQLEAGPPTASSAVTEDRYPERRVAFPDGVVGLADVVYSTVSGFRPLTLDLYLPPKSSQASAPSPAIIYVHGGGWTGGHTRHSGAFENWPQVLASLAARRYVVASVNYRLSSEAPSPAAEQDIKAAVRWLRKHASEYGIDKTRIGIWGGSAGGQLAALAGTSCGVAALDPIVNANATAAVESNCVQSVVAWYGVFDFEPLARSAGADTPVARYLGCGGTACADEKVAMASAIRYVDRSDPPFLLIHGDRDKTVAVSQSKAFHEALRSKGVRSELLIIPDVDHSFVGADAQLTRRASLRALQATVDFFDATLGKRE